MLKLEIRVGESIKIGDVAIVTLEEKSGRVARLAIDADKSIAISRVQQQNSAQLAARMGITGKQ